MRSPGVAVRIPHGDSQQFQEVNLMSRNRQFSGINDDGQMVGNYGDDILVGQQAWPTPNAFVLDQDTFTQIQLPVADVQVTWTNTIVGNEFVGMYVDSLGNIEGFEAAVSQ
jgi:hypothetical protein